MEEKATCVAIVPSPGYTHLVPLVEFTKRLTSLHIGIHFKFIIPTLGPPTDSMITILNSLQNSNLSPTTFTFLPQISIEDLPQDASTAALMQLTVSHSLASFKKTLTLELCSKKVVAVVADYFAVETLSVAKEFSILSYIYYPGNALSLSLFFHLPYLDKTTSCEFKDLKEPIKMPGCIPIHGCDFPSTVQNRSSIVYKSFIYVCKMLHLADGIILNAFTNLEADTIKSMQKKEAKLPPIYPIGPIIQTDSTIKVKESEFLMDWLDNQSCKSVLYVSFGSGGTLNQEQICELALGLELSGVKFLWVVRAPNKSPNAAYLKEMMKNNEKLNFLPRGFLERTKGNGLVVSSWVPQIEILSHESIGGFLTHCGWNSTLESIVNGVPLIVWPLFAEQRVNSLMLCEDLKVALRPKVVEGNKGMVRREEIAQVVRSVIIQDKRGKEIRRRLEEIKIGAMGAMKESTRIITQLVLMWKKFR